MLDKDKIVKAVFASIDEVNLMLPKDKQVEKSMAVMLFGSNSTLDSLGLVNLIVAVEQEVEEEFGISLVLADERAMRRKQNPFSSIATLVDYVYEMISQEVSDVV